jgi:hypothetical protein
MQNENNVVVIYAINEQCEECVAHDKMCNPCKEMKAVLIASLIKDEIEFIEVETYPPSNTEPLSHPLLGIYDPDKYDYLNDEPLTADTIVIDVDSSKSEDVKDLIIYLMDSDLEWSIQDYIGRGDDL